MFETFLFLFFLPSEYIPEKIGVQLNWENRGTVKHHFQIDLKNFDDSVISDPFKVLDYHLFKLNKSLFSVFSGVLSVLWWYMWNTEWLKMYILRLARQCIFHWTNQDCSDGWATVIISKAVYPSNLNGWYHLRVIPGYVLNALYLPPQILNRQKKPIACPATNPHVNIQNTYD